MHVKKWAILLFLLPFIAGCAGMVHKRFVKNFTSDRQETDGSFSSLISNLKYNDKKQHLVVALESGQIEIWDVNKTHSKIAFKAHEYPANMLAFTNDGTALFTGSKFEESTKLWNVRTGELIQTIRKMKGPVGATPNKNIYVVGNGEYVSLYNLSRDIIYPEKYASGGLITAIACDESSGLIATGTEAGTIEVWKYSENKGTAALAKVTSVRPYATGDWIVGLEFSARGDSLYSVARFGSFNEWEPKTLEKKKSMTTALAHIFSTSFYKDKKQLAIAGTEGKPGLGPTTIEVISLATNESRLYRLNISLAMVEILPPLSSFIASQGQLTSVQALPKK